MRKFLHNCKGAVTVLVTLLLIPAMLITGTGVDVARLYAARSVTRDANLLAANAVLTTYDAALQDLYGLYAIAGEDEALQTMVDTYVRASLLGEEVTEAQLGQFRLFWGPEAIDSTLTFETDSSLDNVAVLRRQIEEYAKWRVPVAFANELIALLKSEDVEQLSNDTQAVQDKIALDQNLQELAAAYQKVKEAADALPEAYEPVEEAAFEGINEYLENIYDQFGELFSTRIDYECLSTSVHSETEEDILRHYDDIIDNIDHLLNGGWVNSTWGLLYTDPETFEETWGWWDDPHWISRGLIRDAVLYADQLDATKTKFDALTTACQTAQNAKDSVEDSLAQLKATLESGNCSDELKANMEAEIAAFENLASYDFVALGSQMRSQNETYIDGVSSLFQNLQSYGQITNNTPDDPKISFSRMENMRHDYNFAIDFNAQGEHSFEEDFLAQIAFVPDFTYDAPNGFVRFEDCSAAHRECYENLNKLGDVELKSEDEPLTSEEEKGVSDIEEIFRAVKNLWDGLTKYDASPGALSYPQPEDGSGSIGEARREGMTLDLTLGNDEDGSIGNDLVATVTTLCDLVTGETSAGTIVGNALDGMVDRGLLVGYSTMMFSCWTTGEGKKSLTGQPISAENNYFCNSELEYLYKGSLNAKTNLGAVTNTMLIIRFIANFASSYIIPDINTEIKGYAEIVSAVPYVGVALRFLVRPLIVFAESVYDVASLRSGSSVPIIKRYGYEWNISIGNTYLQLSLSAINALTDELKSKTQPSDSLPTSPKKTPPDDITEVHVNPGLTYEDYLTIFLLSGDPNTIASRVGDLIALNVTTVNEGLCENNPDTKNKDERAEAMKNVSVFDLSKSYTTFSIKTDTEVRFMFLSMPFAQKGMNGVIPPRTFPLSETTYRGY